MAQGDLDGPSVTPEIRPARRSPVWVRGLVYLAILPLIGFIGGKSWTLWDEWRALRKDEVGARSSAVIGYININPKPSLAGRPENWLHDEGDQTFVWAGYQDAQHRWFRFAKGQLDVQKLSMPIGRDSIRAIDRPIYESKGGVRWNRLPDEAVVVGLDEGEEPPAYPIRLMDKVMIVNDQINDRPTLAIYTPVEEVVSFYRADHEGRRIVMGQSGYFVGYHPLMFDRETESLWLAEGGRMIAVAGTLKGTSLPRIARVASVAWGDWRGRHPRSRLLIGADRSKSVASREVEPTRWDLDDRQSGR